MKFDLFHSVGRIDSVPNPKSDRQTFEQFAKEVQLAESMGLETVWVAESHFSSEIQKSHPQPVIPNYHGEVGLNADCFQLAHWIIAKTKKIGFGTAILNIVGGNGGPIAAADRVRSLAYYNHLSERPRKLHIGVASGRFPYINSPFGIVPRNPVEEILWPQYKRLIFIEALEIFLRLTRGDVLADADLTRHRIGKDMFPKAGALEATNALLEKVGHPTIGEEQISYSPRWSFEKLKLVPELDPSIWSTFMNFVLGSSDPLARDLGLSFADLDLFNLSFTAPDKLNAIHQEMTQHYQASGKTWRRDRLPRTVLVFIDQDSNKAQQLADRCFNTYIEAMRGTVQLPPKNILLDRALVGDPKQILDQLSADHPKGFQDNDRLMLWFEFNQAVGSDIQKQMQLFGDQVIAKL